MKNQSMGYSEYTVTLHPLHYGKQYTDEERQKFASAISDRIKRQFPGLVVQINEQFGSPVPTRGPDRKIVRDIDKATIAALHEVVPDPGPTRAARRAQAKVTKPAG